MICLNWERRCSVANEHLWFWTHIKGTVCQKFLICAYQIVCHVFNQSLWLTQNRTNGVFSAQSACCLCSCFSSHFLIRHVFCLVSFRTSVSRLTHTHTHTDIQMLEETVLMISVLSGSTRRRRSLLHGQTWVRAESAVLATNTFKLTQNNVLPRRRAFAWTTFDLLDGRPVCPSAHLVQTKMSWSQSAGMMRHVVMNNKLFTRTLQTHSLTAGLTDCAPSKLYKSTWNEILTFCSEQLVKSQSSWKIQDKFLLHKRLF